MLLNHSLLNGHPKFLGYITSSAAPLGALADLLAATINPNVGAQILSPMATEIEKQTVKWLAEFIGVSPDYGGILVSGGNMANFTAFLAARTAKAPSNDKRGWPVRQLQKNMLCIALKLPIPGLKKRHFYLALVPKLFVDTTDDKNKLNTDVLEKTIQQDLKNGYYTHDGYWYSRRCKYRCSG